MKSQRGIILGDNDHRLVRCPYRQDLKLFCGEKDCKRSGCPIFEKESEQLAYALSQQEK